MTTFFLCSDLGMVLLDVGFVIVWWVSGGRLGWVLHSMGLMLVLFGLFVLRHSIGLVDFLPSLLCLKALRVDRWCFGGFVDMGSVLGVFGICAFNRVFYRVLGFGVFWVVVFCRLCDLLVFVVCCTCVIGEFSHEFCR